MDVRRGSTAIGILLLAVSAALPFVPPRAAPLLAPPPDADLSARLFPGVPAAWVGVRLAALALGTLLTAAALPALPPLRTALRRADTAPARVPGAWLALTAALLHLASAPLVPRLATTGQGLYVLAGFVPGAWLWGAARRSGARSARDARLPLAVPALVAAWLALRMPLAWHAPGVADSIDGWLNFGWLEQALGRGANLLTTGPQPGLTNLHLVFLGAPLLGPGRLPPSLAWMQAAQAIYVAATALLLAAIAARLAGRPAALVATAGLLFSPFVLALPYVATVFALPCAGIAWLMWLALRFHTSASPAALACLGALGGVATTIPQLAPFAAIAGTATLAFLWRGPRLPWVAWSIATASFLALALPGFPSPATFAAMRGAYLDVCGQWAGLQALLLGQASPYDPPAWNLWHAGRPGPADIALGALLAPFATPRTALRLWGDVYLEPLSACAMAIGVALCVRAARRERGAALLLIALLLAILPGLTSAYDRASLTRPIGLPLVAMLFAGLGFEALRRALVPHARPGRAAVAGAAAIALSGIVLFDGVNPRILPRSSLGILLRVLDADPSHGPALLLVHGGRDDLDWLHVERIARHGPPEPLESLRYEGPESLSLPGSGGRPPAELLFYSPALERDRRVTSGICARWPDAALYTFLDDAALSRVLAARPAGAGWTPRWPGGRWQLRRCATRAGADPAGS